MKDACGSIFSLGEEDGRKHGSGSEAPRCAKVKMETAFLDERRQGGNVMGLGNAIMEILSNIDSQFLGRFDQGLKGIPCVDPLGHAYLQAHIAFADALSGTQFCRMVVQKDLWMGKHHQQRIFFPLGQRFASVQLLVAAGRPKELIEGGVQALCLRLARMVSVGQQVSVECPEILGELLEEVEMGKEVWDQFLVVAILMNPTQSELGGQAVELRSIIAQEQRNHGRGGLGSVGRDCQSFLDPPSQRVCLCRQGPIQDGVELTLGVGLIGWQEDRKQTLPLSRDAKVPQQLEGKVVHLKDGIGSPLQHAKQAETIFARQRQVGGIQGVAEDMTLFLFPIDGRTGTVEMVPWATCQSGIPHGSTFRMEQLLVFDQQIGELSRADRHSYRVQEVQNIGLAHPICIVQRQDPCFDSGSKLTVVAGWKRRQIGLFVTGRVIFFFAKSDAVRAKRNVLHNHLFIAFKLSIIGQEVLLNLDHLDPVNLDLGLLIGFAVGCGLITFFFRGEKRRRFLWRECGGALFPP